MKYFYPCCLIYCSPFFKVWYKVKPFMDNYHSVQEIETRVFSPTSIGRPEGPAPKRRKANSMSRR